MSSLSHRRVVIEPINGLLVYRVSIKSFRCSDTEKLFHGEGVRRFQSIQSEAHRKLEMVAAAKRLDDLLSPPANRLEALKSDRIGQHSIRVNDQFRVCFHWNDGAENVEIVDYH